MFRIIVIVGLTAVLVTAIVIAEKQSADAWYIK